MGDLIRRSDLKQHINSLSSHWLCEWDTLGVLAAVDSIPAVDAVEVVRCADCKWCHAGFCEFHDDIIPWGAPHTRWRDWFCADGQRREEANNG